MNSLLEQVAAGAALILVIILFVGGSIAFVRIRRLATA
jgi:hypothetical protein